MNNTIIRRHKCPACGRWRNSEKDGLCPDCAEAFELSLSRRDGDIRPKERRKGSGRGWQNGCYNQYQE